MSLVFVYGSLKEGFPNAHINTGVKLPGTFRTRERLPMYLLGEGHVPCIVLSPGTGHQVHGEVYEVDSDMLEAMDRLERLGEAIGYSRVSIEVEAIAAGHGMRLRQIAGAGGLRASACRPLVEYTSEHTARFSWEGAA